MRKLRNWLFFSGFTAREPSLRDFENLKIKNAICLFEALNDF